MGTLMFWSEPNALFNATLAKMLGHLQASRYVGYVDINCIANSKGVYPLEFTTRFGYPTINIQMEGVISPWGEFLYGLAKGEKYDLKTKKGFQVGVVVAVPPFPYDDKKETEIYRDSSIIFKKPNTEGVHLGDVKLVDGDWHLAGESGYAIVVTGSNGTVEEARHQAYRRIKNIMLQNMFYRTDIGLKWYTESDQLQTWGIL
jgi:phosphoribosylamine--glycine ligase